MIVPRGGVDAFKRPLHWISTSCARQVTVHDTWVNAAVAYEKSFTSSLGYVPRHLGRA